MSTAFELTIAPGETKTIDFGEFELLSITEVKFLDYTEEMKGKQAKVSLKFSEEKKVVKNGEEEITKEVDTAEFDTTLEPESLTLSVNHLVFKDQDPLITVEGPTKAQLVGKFVNEESFPEEEEEDAPEDEAE